MYYLSKEDWLDCMKRHVNEMDLMLQEGEPSSSEDLVFDSMEDFRLYSAKVNHTFDEIPL